MVRNTLFALTAVLHCCISFALLTRTASAAAVSFNPNAQQISLDGSNVIGATDAYNESG